MLERCKVNPCIHLAARVTLEGGRRLRSCCWFKTKSLTALFLPIQRRSAQSADWEVSAKAETVSPLTLIVVDQNVKFFPSV